MNNVLLVGEQVQVEEASMPVAVASPVVEPSSGMAAVMASQEKLDEVDNIDFLLEEIENKIAPLALA